MNDNAVGVSVCLVCFDSKDWNSIVILCSNVLTDMSLVDVNDSFHISRLVASENFLHDHMPAQNS